MSARYKAPHLPKWKADAVEQGWFDFLVPYRSPMVSPIQAAKSLGRDRQFVYALIERGKLEAHGVPGREVQRYTITRRSLLLYLAESANYSPEDLPDRVADILSTLTREALEGCVAKARAKIR